MTEALLNKIICIKKASRAFALVSAEKRSECLYAMAELMRENKSVILEANAKDREIAESISLERKRINILSISEKDIEAMAAYFEDAAKLEDIVGTVTEHTEEVNGLIREKKLIPLGVVLAVYEARPSVITDSAALCMRTANAIIFKGSRNAVNTDKALVDVLKKACGKCGIDENVIALVDETGHEISYEMVQLDRYIDLAIVRGGYSALADIKKQSNIPVIGAGPGNCHIFIDESAQKEMAINIAVNSKVPRPLACNATETILIHKNWPMESAKELVETLQEKGITLRGCEKMAQLFGLEKAEEKDWAEEYFAPFLAVKIVDDIYEAVEHINTYRTPHTETIVTDNSENAAYFMANVEANVVSHNASTRLTDGIGFGLGGEMGISTQKYPCAGPIGMRHMMQEKYFLFGKGTLR